MCIVFQQTIHSWLKQLNTVSMEVCPGNARIKAAANVNAVMAQGKTPLHVAIQQSGCSTLY